MFESKGGVLWIGGIGFFIFAFLSNGLVPIFMYQHLPERQLPELTNANVMYAVEDLARRYPEQFKTYVGEPTPENCEKLLAAGRKIYIGEGCWHCHSQFVRPVANESKRFGPVARSEEYQNVLQRPVMFGTRRVGPDLSREGGRRGSDWHAIHFWKPQSVSTNSPMPNYPWFFDDNDPNKPNARGLAIITYVQWLGSWLESYPLYETYQASDDPGKTYVPGTAVADPPADMTPPVVAPSSVEPAADSTATAPNAPPVNSPPANTAPPNTTNEPTDVQSTSE
ncbi:MAG: cbb3-type cytochrome c oxidase subunit II [Pirellulales bacterium]|nr:cbb3-type cytochrome c oxidase subunit II [Pirellulales bacterium]